ncbi:MAG: lytic murein transglycosylase [Alphaproteobacteria bacterium]|nr:lytic murein transglycosylase [Alphaproteobacteria bacterium]
MNLRVVYFLSALLPTVAFGATGTFDMERWNTMLDNVRERAAAQNISTTTIDAVMQTPKFIPSIVKSDRNQSEFKLTLAQYLARTVNANRIADGRRMRGRYPTLLGRVENAYGIPSHVVLAFWGMETNYGTTHGRHKLKNAFFTLMYDGRREKFFGDQLLALMKIADDNKLDVNEIRGSWAGAMGHFQFIPTTLQQYGTDGNGDGRIDIINNVSDAMFSAGNYLNKLGWNPNERIVRRVILPADFDIGLLDGKTKKSVLEWSRRGVLSSDGTALPQSEIIAGIVADTSAIDNEQTDYNPDTDVQPTRTITAYLTYPNFYRIKKWNNSNWYAIAIAELSDKLK